MKTKSILTLLVLVSASAIAAETPPSLTTPDKVETRNRCGLISITVIL